MSEDSFTEFENESWFSRIGGALKGIVIGFALVALSVSVLFWNEGRAVKRAKTLEEGGGAVVTVSADKVDASQEGKLIHVSGKAVTKLPVTDKTFGISADGLRLRRKVEMYQWREETDTKTEKKLGGSKEKVTTYTYKKDWSESHNKSDNFKKPEGHKNPVSMPYESKTINAKDVQVGERKLTESLVSNIGNFKRHTLKGVKLSAQLAKRAKVSNNEIYIVSNPQQIIDSKQPQIGDIRVTYELASAATVSIIAGQVKNTFEPYFTESGGSLQLLEMGQVSAKGMIQQAQESNKTTTWILRAVGLIVMVIGFNMMMSIASVLADVIPFLGDVVGAGTGIIAFLMSGVLSFGTIALAWLFYRPLIGGALLAVTVGLAVFAFMKVKGTKTAPNDEAVA